MLQKAGFTNIETTVVDKEPETPQFQTLLAVAYKPAMQSHSAPNAAEHAKSAEHVTVSRPLNTRTSPSPNPR